MNREQNMRRHHSQRRSQYSGPAGKENPAHKLNQERRIRTPGDCHEKVCQPRTERQAQHQFRRASEEPSIRSWGDTCSWAARDALVHESLFLTSAVAGDLVESISMRPLKWALPEISSPESLACNTGSNTRTASAKSI